MNGLSAQSPLVFLLTALAARAALARATGFSPDASIPFEPEEVLALASKVADHQLHMIAAGPAASRLPPGAFKETDRVQGALFIGLRDLADRLADLWYRAAILERGRSTGWEPGPRVYHADDQVIGQAYLWAATHGAGPEAIAPLRTRFDRILAQPPTGTRCTAIQASIGPAYS